MKLNRKMINIGMINTAVMVMLALVLLAPHTDLRASDRKIEYKPSPATKNSRAEGDYQKECGSCHLAYPAHLLPKRSWQQLMSNLSDHFGDNAELSAMLRTKIAQYLERNGKASRNSGKAGKPAVPLRITELGWFRHEHDEIPARIRNDPKVGKLSRCETCHQEAKSGRFTENKINIPGYGRVDD